MYGEGTPDVSPVRGGRPLPSEFVCKLALDIMFVALTDPGQLR